MLTNKPDCWSVLATEDPCQVRLDDGSHSWTMMVTYGGQAYHEAQEWSVHLK